MASELYFMLHFTRQSLAILVFMWSSAALMYLMNERFLYSFTLKINEAALSYYIRPHAHSNVSAANFEELSRKKLLLFDQGAIKRETRETFRKMLNFYLKI